jgi:hypothetical protein
MAALSPSSPDTAHGADHLVAAQDVNEFPASKLAAAVAMNHAPGDIIAARHRTTEGLGGQAGLHPRVDGVADDAVGEHVFDRTDVELALAGPVFSNVGQPQLIWRIGGEIPADQIVMDRWADLAILAALALAERTPPTVVRADPPRGPLGHRLPGIAGFGDQEAVAKLRVIAVGVEQSVGSVGGGQLGVGDRVGQPAVVGLAGELEHPARHRHGDPVGGELFHERVKPFPGRFDCDK